MTRGPCFFQAFAKVRVSGLSPGLEEGLAFPVAQTLTSPEIRERKAARCPATCLDVLLIVSAQNGLFYPLHLGLEDLQLRGQSINGLLEKGVGERWSKRGSERLEVDFCSSQRGGSLGSCIYLRSALLTNAALISFNHRLKHTSPISGHKAFTDSQSPRGQCLGVQGWQC